MQVRTIGVLAGVAVVAMGGCTVSRSEYFNTAYGPGKSPETYRVGGLAPEPEVGSKVVLVRSADLEVASSTPTTGGSHASATPHTAGASTAHPAAPKTTPTPVPVPSAPAPTATGTPYSGK